MSERVFLCRLVPPSFLFEMYCTPALSTQWRGSRRREFASSIKSSGDPASSRSASSLLFPCFSSVERFSYENPVRQEWRPQRSLVGFGSGDGAPAGGFLRHRLAFLAPQVQGDQRQPDPSGDNLGSLDKTERQGEHSILGDRRTHVAEYYDQKYERPSNPGVCSPTPVLRVSSETPSQHEARDDEHDKDHHGVDPVDPAVPGLRVAFEGSTRRISPAGVGHKHSCCHEAQSEEADQQRSPDRSPPRAPYPPQPCREGDAQQSADDEVGDLLPTLVAQFKVAPIVTPGAVAGPGRLSLVGFFIKPPPEPDEP